MTSAIILLSGYFILSLWLRSYFPRICAMCSAVALTWVSAVIWPLFGGAYLIDDTALAILMGGSAVGLLYYLSGASKLLVDFFKFPALLTLFTVAYFVLEDSVSIDTTYYLTAIWVVFILLYASAGPKTELKSSMGTLSILKKVLKRIYERVVVCCKNW